jgi:hypothetical protein
VPGGGDVKIGDLVKILYNQQVGIVTRIIENGPDKVPVSDPRILEIMSEGRTRSYLASHVEVIE